MLAQKVLDKSFTRFPQATSEIGELVNQFMTKEKDKTKYVLDVIVEQEINYLFTNDYD